MEAALRDPDVLEALILLLERFEMPPVMIGVGSPEPEQVLKRFSDMLHLADWLGDAPQSRIVTAQGEKITVNEIAMDQVLTAERRRQWLEEGVNFVGRDMDGAADGTPGVIEQDIDMALFL